MANKAHDRKAEKEKDEAKVEIGFDAENIGLGGLFKGIGNLIDLVSKLSDEGTEKTGEIKGLGKDVKGVYGFRIRTLVGGKPLVDSFGNIKETKRGPVVEEVREPMIDIFDEKDQIRVIAEMPGVSEEDIKVEANGDILNLSTSGKDRKYAKELLLPSKVKSDPIKISSKNGIVEIRLEKEAGNGDPDEEGMK
jgi:HSP20 family protein